MMVHPPTHLFGRCGEREGDHGGSCDPQSRETHQCAPEWKEGPRPHTEHPPPQPSIFHRTSVVVDGDTARGKYLHLHEPRTSAHVARYLKSRTTTLFEHFTSDESEDNRIAMVDRLPPPSHPHPHTTSHSPPSYHLTSPFTLHTPRPPQQSEASQSVEKKRGARSVPFWLFSFCSGGRGV